MQKVIMTRGLPASGKSTWARQFIKDNPGWKRINKDDLRAMIHDGVFTKENEATIVDARNALVRTFLSAGHSVIIDDTNIQDIHIKKVFHLVSCEFPDVQFEVMDFDTDRKECIHRDKFRDASVGAAVINKMNSQLERIDKDDWKYLVETRTPIVEHDGESRQSAIIVDIDGTLAVMGDRSPYDWHRVDEDMVNESVAGFVKRAFGEHFVIIMSGRSDKAKDKTVKWLEDNNIPYDLLLMRKPEDYRPDYIIKSELYQEHVLNKLNVIAVFDDRDQVVHMWRKHHNLTVFQVDYGNF